MNSQFRINKKRLLILALVLVALFIAIKIVNVAIYMTCPTCDGEGYAYFKIPLIFAHFPFLSLLIFVSQR